MVLGWKAWLAPPVREKTAQKWAALSQALHDGGRPPARHLREEAESLYREVGRFLQLSDPRALRVRQRQSNAVLRPGTEWAWRPMVLRGPVAPAGIAAPEAGQEIGGEVAIWHDCEHRALILRQTQNRDAADQSPFGLNLEVLAFTGSYLSLSMVLPATVQHQLGRNHIIQLDVVLQTEMPVKMYGRLNLLQGPNTEQLNQELKSPDSSAAASRTVEYDLAYADLSARPVEKVWLDLIVESPYMNAVCIRDIVLTRYPRAEM